MPFVVSHSTDPRAKALIGWYRENARDLPWRREVSPYRTLVSEIMLQQTRAAAVIPYFERFLAALPTIEALSVVDDETLLKLWQGLGYYSRARNLKKCAEAVMREHKGILPRSVPELRRLPGIGPYTAGAIAAFAYGEGAVAIDGNVLRVASRLFFEEGDIGDPKTRARIEARLSEMLPSGMASDFGQGLIELGAIVCVPNAKPKCEICPLAPYCEAHRRSLETALPNRRPKAKRRIEERTVLLVRSDTSLLIRRRPSKGLLAGLFELPSLDGRADERTVLAYLRDLGLEALRIEPAPPSKHIFTHVEWHMTAYSVLIAEPEHRLAEPYRLALPSELAERYPLPSAFSAYLLPITRPFTEINK